MGVVFEIGNSFTRVKADNRIVLTLIYNVLSYQVENHEHIARRMGNKWDGIKSFFDKKTCSFMTGFLPTVKSELIRAEIAYSEKDYRIIPEFNLSKEITLEGIKLYDFQIKAAQDFLKVGRGVAHLATGAGKTEVAIYLTKLLQLPTLFLTHRINLLEQTAERFIRRCPSIKQMGIIGNGIYEPRAVTIATVQTLFSMAQKHPEVTQELLSKFKFLIIDEAHRSGANQFHVPASLCQNAYFRLALTATPFMKSAQDNLYLQGVTGNVVARVSNGELIERGILAKPYFKFFRIDTPDLSRMRNWRDVYERGIINNTHRNNIIINQAIQLKEKGKKILIIVSEKAHGKFLEEQICKGIRAKYLDGDSDSHARAKAIAQIKLNKLDAIIATNIFDEGVDVSDINAIILAGGTKSAPALFQRTGRALRKKEQDNYAIIIDFIDTTNKNLLEHSMARYNLIKNEKGFTIL